MRIGGVLGPACDVDDAGVQGLHTLEEEQDEEEVGEVVYLEGSFVAVFCEALAAFRHVACV